MAEVEPQVKGKAEEGQEEGKGSAARMTTNQLIYLRDTVLRELMSHPSAEPFLGGRIERSRDAAAAVEEEEEPSDEDQEEEDGNAASEDSGKMDLSKVHHRLQEGSYECADRCLEDLDLIFDNCFKTFRSNQDEWRQGKKLEVFYLHKLQGMPMQEVRIEDVR